jgi:hypothetical protein
VTGGAGLAMELLQVAGAAITTLTEQAMPDSTSDSEYEYEYDATETEVIHLLTFIEYH